MTEKRYAVLDGIRGFALLNMIVYHAVWDFVYVLDFRWQWYRSEAAYIWQQYICWTFIFLSGFCQPLGRKKFKKRHTGFPCRHFGIVCHSCFCTAEPDFVRRADIAWFLYAACVFA